MTKTTDRTDLSTRKILQILTVWRGFFGLGALGASISLWTGILPDISSWQRILITIVASLVVIFSVLAILDILQRRHRGRTISLFLDYLGFVVCAVLLLNTGQVFTGIDALAEEFASGIVYLGIVFVGYLIGTVSERLTAGGTTEGQIRLISKWVMGIGVALFLWQINAINGLIFFFTNLFQPMGIITIAGALLFGSALWAAWREPTAKLLQAKTHHEAMLNGWLFLSPNLLGFLIFFAGPLLLSLYFSFTDSDAFNPPNWVGFDNYAKILNVRFATLASPDQLARDVIDTTIYDEVGRLKLGNRGILFAAADQFFWLALRNTLTFALFAVPLSVIPALFLANILNSKLPGMKFFRAVYFIPSIAAIVGISLVWQWLYNATIGYINYFITLGVDFLNNSFYASLVDPKIQWVSDERTALMSVIIIAAWQTMGFNTVLFLAGLQNIPGELYEAATVDGAGPWAKFWGITLPMLAPSTFYVVTTSTIQAMQVFEQVFILMNPPEGPNNSTITLVLYLYRSGFINFKQGYASAIAWTLFIVIFGITLLQFQRQRSSSIYES